MERVDHVTLEQAKELKRLGFDWKCGYRCAIQDIEYEYWNGQEYCVRDAYEGESLHPEAEERVVGYEYIEEGIEHPITEDDLDEFVVYVPTLCDAATWLRDKHHLAVLVKLNGVRTMWFSEVWTMTTNGPVYHEHGVLFDSYEEALSNGISKALELLADKEQ